jgi:hypothetical protein
MFQHYSHESSTRFVKRESFCDARPSTSQCFAATSRPLTLPRPREFLTVRIIASEHGEIFEPSPHSERRATCSKKGHSGPENLGKTGRALPIHQLTLS